MQYVELEIAVSHWPASGFNTYDSELQGQEAGRMQQTSELFTGSTILKFVNALYKSP